jgi:ABC-type multidrug transport system ATPase subunit
MIITHDLSKHYRERAALNPEIAPGEVFGLLGPNGAGKPPLPHALHPA